MKYSPAVYSKALMGALAEESVESQEKIVENFVKLLKRSGDIEKIDNIMSVIEKATIKKKGGRTVDVIVPRKLPEALLSKIKNSFTAKDKITIKIDEKIISGVKIIIDDEKIIDNSLATTLKRMFI
ncbi:MAG: F0F1 ATP synthase subunit delta [Patescibacteria group bacterium]